MNETRFSRIAAFVLLAASIGVSADVAAATAEKADLISDVTLQIRSHASEDDGTALVGISECERMLSNDSTVTVTWTFAAAGGSNIVEAADSFSVARDSDARTDCSSGELCRVIPDDDLVYETDTVSAEIAFEDLLEAAGHTTCEGFDLEFFLRLTVLRQIGSTDTQNADAKIIVDTIRPSAPSGVTATASDNTITVEFEAAADTDINRYVVYYSTEPFDGGQIPDGMGLFEGGVGDKTRGVINADLEGAQEVYVAVASEDETGNISALSGAVSAQVIETNDFWESYRSAGGAETGGCSTTDSPATLWPLFFIGLFFVGYRRRESGGRLMAPIAATAFVAALAIPATASAESPIRGAFDLKVGGYYPAIDGEFEGGGPFEETFGNQNMIMGELEVDGWLWQGFGKFGIGGHIGFSRVKGDAIAVDSSEQAEVAEETRFSVMPFRASLVYRFDWLAQNTRIPLAATVKGGLDWYRWRIREADGDTAEFDGDRGAGWKSGWHFAGGLQFLLDFIDPATAAAFDLNWGINNSYITVEYMMTRIDGFGSDGFDLSDDLLMFGLSFEY